MIPSKIEEKSLSILQNIISKKIKIKDTNIVYGGCINNSVKILTNYGDFFLKWNNKNNNIFESESRDLEVLRKTNTIHIPKIIGFDKNVLIIEFIKEGPATNIFWQKFGRRLSNLHKKSNSHFGLDQNNFIGSLDQHNEKEVKWIKFFRTKRIIPQLSISNFPTDLLTSFDKLFLKIENLFPEENPALLHGDLWSGNFICSNNDPVLIDPAIYFGHREMDISMTKLFGGFHNTFYESYNENYPLHDGWQEREKICNLYPLLVHANLFGGNYYNQIEKNIKYFIGS